MSIGVVVTTCAGREANLQRTLAHLAVTNPAPVALVVVYDGCPAFGAAQMPASFRTVHATIPKHGPGAEQPRNVGARILREESDATHVWFLDSDLVFAGDILAKLGEQVEANSERILIGPYEFLPQGIVSMDPGLRTDIRWVSFDDHGPEDLLVNDLGAALACFGGNLVWPLDAFERIGGFHPDLHHGRCEDGELGLRAAAAGIPMSFVRDARAWHVWHPVDHAGAVQKNARDVPLLNSWHPWVQERGMILTEADGARWDFRCPECGMTMNSHDYWTHVSYHKTGVQREYNDPASVQGRRRDVADDHRPIVRARFVEGHAREHRHAGTPRRPDHVRRHG